MNLVRTRQGNYSLRVACSDGSEKTIHSLYDPVGEASGMVDAFAFGGEGMIVVLGLGLGYHLDELRRRHPHARIVVVEASQEILDLCREHGKGTEPSDTVRFITGAQQDQPNQAAGSNITYCSGGSGAAGACAAGGRHRRGDRAARALSRRGLARGRDPSPRARPRSRRRGCAGRWSRASRCRTRSSCGGRGRDRRSTGLRANDASGWPPRACSTDLLQLHAGGGLDAHRPALADAARRAGAALRHGGFRRLRRFRAAAPRRGGGLSRPRCWPRPRRGCDAHDARRRSSGWSARSSPACPGRRRATTGRASAAAHRALRRRRRRTTCAPT